MLNRRWKRKALAFVLSVASLLAVAGAPSALAETADPRDGYGLSSGEGEEELPANVTVFEFSTIYEESGTYNPITKVTTADSGPARIGKKTILGGCDDRLVVDSDGKTFIFTSTTPTIDHKTVSKIGIRTLKCQRLIDGVWTDYLTSKDLYNTNSNSYYIRRPFVAVRGSYYRMYIEHYAQNDLWLGFYDYDVRVCELAGVPYGM